MELELPEGATVSDLAQDVLRRYPRITQDPASLVVAVNQEYRDHDYVLHNGDEVALIPPVSGGCFAGTTRVDSTSGMRRSAWRH